MGDLPKECPKCGCKELFLKFLDDDDDDEIKHIACACIECQIAYVVDKSRFKNHEHAGQIIEFLKVNNEDD